MVSITTQRLLENLAENYRAERESYSRQEIVKKMNEIKYLSSQKKIPKLSLRKEIIHLENKMKGIFELEKQLEAERKRSNRKVGALKGQITILRKKIAASEDKDVHKKMDQLSHLLGENLAKKEISRDVAFQRIIYNKPLEKGVTEEDIQEKLNYLHDKVRLLKHELNVPGKTDIAESKMNLLQAKIAMIESKIAKISTKPEPEVFIHEDKPKHTMIFASPVKNEESIKNELPLPPAPKF